ncbi:hypothetical protein HCN44_007791 [Aphidius gifuensis]|uniref:dynamin GTPase n=1 Tax=Aphidius gifuensis TaxID=684658 RepID=A0A835CL01_APHGI|nr:hypothetical protein HCN44_007791 [Aphidius gifuensis]
MKELIPLVNKLQDLSTKIGESLELDLPQIAVVGGQSAGKSSVLENFVGWDFLPRGTGIVTRRPLILQLIHKRSDYAEFSHTGNEKFEIDEIRDEIEEETRRETQGEKGISRIPIRLRIYSPNVLNLTLVDLPGLTKVPVFDQPKDIEYQIRGMILEYIRKKNCLILAVTPANTDLANSDALKLAKEVDPEGIRTIGVLTKLDLMDEGTDARFILENKLIPLKRGYVGVVNRSQKNIDGEMNIKDSIKAEKAYFENHDVYHDMANKLGTSYLQCILNQQLEIHIRNTLPDFRDKFLMHQQKLHDDLKKYRKYLMIDESSSETGLLMQILKELRVEFDNAMGNFEYYELSKTPNIGCKIFDILHTKFPSQFSRITYHSPSRAEIDLAIKNIRGYKVGIWTPDIVLKALVKKQFNEFKLPSFVCVDEIVQVLCDGFHLYTRNLSHFPKLRDEVCGIITSHIKNREKICKEVLQQFIDIESGYINTNNDDYKILLNKKKRNSHVQDDHDKVKIYVDTYLEHANKTVKDFVPKAIVWIIIDDCKKFIDTELPNSILQNKNFLSLMEFSQDEKKEYDEIRSIYEACTEALEIIGDRPPVVESDFKPATQIQQPNIATTLWKRIMIFFSKCFLNETN